MPAGPHPQLLAAQAVGRVTGPPLPRRGAGGAVGSPLPLGQAAPTETGGHPPLSAAEIRRGTCQEQTPPPPTTLFFIFAEERGRTARHRLAAPAASCSAGARLAKGRGGGGRGGGGTAHAAGSLTGGPLLPGAAASPPPPTPPRKGRFDRGGHCYVRLGNKNKAGRGRGGLRKLGAENGEKACWV